MLPDKHPVLLSGYLTLQIWDSLWKLNSAMHKATEGFLHSLCRAITHLHTATALFSGPFTWQCSPESLKPGVQWSLLLQWLAPELHLTGHLFCASWTWAIGEYVTMRYMRFLAKHVRCSYVDFYKLWSESNKCHWFYWDSGLDTSPLLLGFRGFFRYYRAPLKNVSL